MEGFKLIDIPQRCIDSEETITVKSKTFEVSAPCDPTQGQRHALIELGGSFGFWDDPAEDVYTMDDGESE